MIEPAAFAHPPRRRVAPEAAVVVVLVGAAAWGYLWPVGADRQAAAVASAATGTFVLSSQPPGARVVVDGKDAGVTPLALYLSPGTHGVFASAASGMSQEFSADVEAGRSTTRHLMLEPPPPGPTASPARHVSTVSALEVEDRRPTHAPRALVAHGDFVPRVDDPTPAPATNGWVSFSLPFDAQVFEGTTFLGLTSDERLYARPGRHAFTLVNDQLGFRAGEAVLIAAGRVTRRVVDPGTATLSVDALPWCEVLIAGRSFGATPLANISLPLGVHQVTLRHPELGERVLPVTIRRGEPNRLSVDLQR